MRGEVRDIKRVGRGGKKRKRGADFILAVKECDSRSWPFCAREGKGGRGREWNCNKSGHCSSRLLFNAGEREKEGRKETDDAIFMAKNGYTVAVAAGWFKSHCPKKEGYFWRTLRTSASLSCHACLFRVRFDAGFRRNEEEKDRQVRRIVSPEQKGPLMDKKERSVPRREQ